MSGDVALDAFIDHLRSLKKLPEDVVREAAAEVLKAARATAKAGTTPDGQPWAAKKDGSRALVNAADHLSVRIAGRTISLVLTGVDVIHNFGTGWLKKRQILPDGGAGMPKNVASAIRATAGRVFSRAMGGR